VRWQARLEFCRIMRRPLGIEAVVRIEHVECGDEGRIRWIVLVRHRRINAAQQVDGIAGMRIREHDAVRREQPSKIVTALDDFVRPLAVGRTSLRHSLIERHQRPAAAVREQQHLGNAGLTPQKLDTRLHVERQLLEIDL
jgi:hypothetical protein